MQFGDFLDGTPLSNMAGELSLGEIVSGKYHTQNEGRERCACSILSEESTIQVSNPREKKRCSIASNIVLAKGNGNGLRRGKWGSEMGKSVRFIIEDTGGLEAFFNKDRKQGTPKKGKEIEVINKKHHNWINEKGVENYTGTYVAVHKESHKKMCQNISEYSLKILRYVEEWDRVATRRIWSRLIEFRRLRGDLGHYAQKVEKLRVHAETTEDNGGRVNETQQRRLERNELKLSGAYEAFDTFGGSSFLLIEEITERVWKDFYPVLVNALHIDKACNLDMNNIFQALEKTARQVEEIGVLHRVKIKGRLQDFWLTQKNEIYTGERHVFQKVDINTLSEF